MPNIKSVIPYYSMTSCACLPDLLDLLDFPDLLEIPLLVLSRSSSPSTPPDLLLEWPPLSLRGLTVEYIASGEESDASLLLTELPPFDLL